MPWFCIYWICHAMHCHAMPISTRAPVNITNITYFREYLEAGQPGGWGGGYSYALPIRVCAAQQGHDFEAPDLERGIHFRGVF